MLIYNDSKYGTALGLFLVNILSLSPTACNESGSSYHATKRTNVDGVKYKNALCGTPYSTISTRGRGKECDEGGSEYPPP